VKKMKIGVDLDGVITPVGFINPSVRLPQWLYILFIPIILLILPTKRKELRKIKVQGHTIIIISARPKWCENLTRIWLKYHWVSFTKIYCVGFGKGTKQRKLQIIEKEEIEIFIDNDRKIKKFLQKNSIKVISFGQLNGWLENSHFYLKRTTLYFI
jgi:uncharacterized HAD superfamily protein